jgi:hypothetical protein
MTIPQIAFNKYTIQNEDDIKLVKTVLRLYMRFIKEHKLVSTLYRDMSELNEDGRLFITSVRDCGRLVIKTTTQDRLSKLKRLRLSQFWRFYLLDHADTLNEFTSKAMLVSAIKDAIKSNGYRESDEIKELFKKYNLSPKQW